MGKSARRGTRQRRVAAVVASGAMVGAAAVGSLGAGVSSASSHREAPLTAADPQIDNTDVYAFVSPDKPDTVTLIANWIPFEEPNGGPNFYPWATDARYNINIDSDGDGKPDLTYRWTFSNNDARDNTTFLYNNGIVNSFKDKTLLFKQTYTLQAIKSSGEVTTLMENAPVAPSNVGRASMPNYKNLRQEAVKSVGDVTSFAGQADDSFFLDLRIFDLLYGGNLSEVGHDTLAGYNVNSIALQVPKSALALVGDAGRNPVVGVWSTTERRSLKLSPGSAKPEGDYVQVSRLGNPLVNEVVVPAGLKDTFNGLKPEKDHTIPAVVKLVTDPEVPRLVESIYGLKAPATPRNDLVEIFLSGISKNSGGPIQVDLNSQLLNKDVDASKFVAAEELRLNMAVPPAAEANRLGVLGGDLAGFPNGRRLTDDVVDIELQALEGAVQTERVAIVDALAAGDGVDANDGRFGHKFPYLALPHTKSVNQAGDRSGDMSQDNPDRK